MDTEPTFYEFVELCRDADKLLEPLLSEPSELKGKQPKNLKAAAVYYLARKRGLHITMHVLHLVYGVTPSSLMKLRRVIEKEVARCGETSSLETTAVRAY